MNVLSSISPPEVSFVVIAHNEAVAVANCLASITAQSGGSTFEIVVVDDGSTDRTAELVMDIAVNRPEIVLVRHGTNLGRGAARSTGVAAARANLIAMVDADIVLPENWLHRCRSTLYENEADAVGGVAVPDGDVTYVHRRFNLTPKLASMRTRVSGSNGLFRREVFDLVRIDPSLIEGEDVALNFAMQEVGLLCMPIDDLIVEHRENKSFLHSLRWLYQSGKGASRQLITYRQIRTPDIALGGLVAIVAFCLFSRGHGMDRRLVWALPSAYLIGVSGTHMAGKFNLRGSTMNWVFGTFANTVLIGAYFVGRVVGVPVALRERTVGQ